MKFPSHIGLCYDHGEHHFPLASGEDAMCPIGGCNKRLAVYQRSDDALDKGAEVARQVRTQKDEDEGE